jgi:hypothetical protein
MVAVPVIVAVIATAVSRNSRAATVAFDLDGGQREGRRGERPAFSAAMKIVG